MIDWQVIVPALTALAGVGFGYLLKRRGDAATWKREDRVRWQADKRSAYAHLLASVGAFERAAGERAVAGKATAVLLAHEVPQEDIPPLPDRPTTDDMEFARSEIELLAPMPVGVQAHMLTISAYQLAAPATTAPVWKELADPSGAEYLCRVKAVIAARQSFLEAARSDLGIDDFPI